MSSRSRLNMDDQTEKYSNIENTQDWHWYLSSIQIKSVWIKTIHNKHQYKYTSREDTNFNEICIK